MATIERFEDLEIWQLARNVYQKVSVISDKLKKNHEYRFAEQTKSAAGSTMDNIGEGFERNSRLEFVNSLSISKCECGELKSETKKIVAFIKYLNNSKLKGLKFKNREN